MSDNQDAMGGFFQTFINYLYSTGDISVPTDFHDRCIKIREMFDDDVSGIVGTIIDYSINSAAEAKLKVECADQTLEDLLTQWLEKINININGIPTGLQELSKEYYKERWSGSSLCLMEVESWKTISSGNTSIKVPTVLYFANGSSVYVDRKSPNSFKLGTDKYYLDKDFKKPAATEKVEIIIQKPFARWFDKYPSPYTIKKGIYKNWLAIKILASKGDEVISKVLPYLFIVKKGTEGQFQKGVDYKDADMKELVEKMKEVIEKYKNSGGKVPLNAIPFDQSYEHLIPDLKNILTEELYRQGYRALLAGLGFIDLLEITPSRQESRMNPKPFITEVNAGVNGFKSMLMDVINLIIVENKIDHKKLFSDKKELKIANSPLKINIEAILDQIRSGFVYGAVSIETYQESLGIDPEQELDRMRKEWKNELRDIYYPHIIQNTEKDPDANIKVPTTKKEVEKTKEKEKASEQLMVKCQKCGNEFDLLSIAEAGMGYVKCPKCQEVVTQEDAIENLEIAPYDKDNPPAFLKKYPKEAQEVFIDVFNKSLPKGEDYAFPVAWSAMKRWLKKHGYKKVNDKWVKSEEIK